MCSRGIMPPQKPREPTLHCWKPGDVTGCRLNVQVASSESKCTEFHCLICSNPSWERTDGMRSQSPPVPISCAKCNKITKGVWKDTQETHDFLDT